MPQPILIFDFGNVLAHFDYAKACTLYGERLGISGPELLDRLRSAGISAMVQRYESGGMTSLEFSRGVSALVGLEMPHDEFAAVWSDIFLLNEPVAALVEQLARQGYTLLLGSNTNELHATHFRAKFARTLAHFRHLVLSYEVGHIKPAREFFHACALAAAAEPEHCVFIDDLAENIEGAHAAGLRGLVFQDVPTLVEDLRALGVRIEPAESLHS